MGDHVNGLIILGRYTERMGTSAFIGDDIYLPLAETIYAGERAVVYGARLGRRQVVVKAGAGAHEEAQLLIDLAHPRIAPCLGVGRLGDGAPAYVSPRFESDLDAHIRRSGPLAPSRAAAIMRDIAAGLAHLHALGFRHGDCAPGNVLLTSDGEAVLSDFEFTAPLGCVEARPAPGVFAYLAPEALDGLGLDARADVYGLGAIGWAILTGGPPTPLAPEPAAPANLIDFLNTCLAPDRRARPDDGGAALFMLDALGYL